MFSSRRSQTPTPPVLLEDFRWPPPDEVVICQPHDVCSSRGQIFVAIASVAATANAVPQSVDLDWPETHDRRPQASAVSSPPPMLDSRQVEAATKNSTPSQREIDDFVWPPREEVVDGTGDADPSIEISTESNVLESRTASASSRALRVSRKLAERVRSDTRGSMTTLRRFRPHFATLACVVACTAIGGGFVADHQFLRDATTLAVNDPGENGTRAALAVGVPMSVSQRGAPSAPASTREPPSRAAGKTKKLTRRNSEQLDRAGYRTPKALIATLPGEAGTRPHGGSSFAPSHATSASFGSEEASGGSALSNPPAEPGVLRPTAEKPGLAAGIQNEDPAPVGLTRAADATLDHATIGLKVEQGRIAAVLQRYSDAYTDLNAGAAKAVWPGVNVRALQRAFDSVASERLELDSCATNVVGSEADVTCYGNLTYVPNAGRKSPRTIRQRWRFAMSKRLDNWTITGVSMR
jgi:hypothetical protein